MKFSRTVFPGAVLAAAVALNVGTAAAAGNGTTALATGSGHFDILGELRTFSFTARTDASGASYGQAELNNREQNNRSHIIIDCLNVAGNVATMSGAISDSRNPAFIGATVIFRVVDKGQGAKATAPDQVSLAFLNSGFVCTDNVGIPLNDVQQGNIQVH
jgi:hypothetical protein